MKRKKAPVELTRLDNNYFVNPEPQILDPIKLDKKALKPLTIEVLGYEFIDTGYALACPQCGKISGISCREDLDKQVDFFLKFGCKHYK